MNRDQWARSILRNEWRKFRGAAPTDTMLQAVGAIARHETVYGHADKPPGWSDTHNWGAIQCAGTVAPCPEGCFEAKDTHADGTPYQGCYKVYPSDEAGAFDLIQTLLAKGLRDALASGNAVTLAAAMKKRGYFEDSIDHYSKDIANNAAAIARAMPEPLRVTLGGPSSSSSTTDWIVVAGVGWLAWREFGKGRRRRG